MCDQTGGGAGIVGGGGERGTEGGRKGGRERGREGGREGGRERGRQGGREREKGRKRKGGGGGREGEWEGRKGKKILYNSCKVRQSTDVPLYQRVD